MAQFMPRRKEIQNCLTKDLFSVEKYDNSTTFENFNENTEFEKWAAVEVSEIGYPVQVTQQTTGYILKEWVKNIIKTTRPQ
jgi:AraC family transcriptional regulator